MSTGERLGAAAALAALPAMTPARLRWLLGGRSAEEAWSLVRRGQLGVPPRSPRGLATGAPSAELCARWRQAARAGALEEVTERYGRSGVEVLIEESPRYPDVLRGDARPPAVLFALRGDARGAEGCGDDGEAGRARVSIVGTRACTPYGREVATRLGRELAEAGVTVVSGLAQGIDASAHRGALGGAGAPPLGIVASGLDVVYPPANRHLWLDVAAASGLWSETPLGQRPEPWRFHWRNRLLAAVADVVVVVESHRGGGSLSTVDAASRRGTTVMAVPGPVTSPASAGTNALLADGCAPARDSSDVLCALGLARAARPGPRRADAGAAKAPYRPRPAQQRLAVECPPPGALRDSDARRVLEALEEMPAPLETVVNRCGQVSIAAALVQLERLEAAGLACSQSGAWRRQR